MKGSENTRKGSEQLMTAVEGYPHRSRARDGPTTPHDRPRAAGPWHHSNPLLKTRW